MRAAACLLYPPRCPLCDRVLDFGGRTVCPDCEKKLPRIGEPACMRCGKPVGREDEFCPDCRMRRHFFDQGRAAFAYAGPIRQSVYRMKAENRRDYLDFYAEEMARAAERYLPRWQPEILTAVPMHWRKRAARGYNQSELLAARISRLTGLPLDRKLLRCVRRPGEQKTLGQKERMRNLRGCFAVREPFPKAESVLVVDDVYTTGATMDEAARALKAAGAGRVFFLVLCIGKGKKSLHEAETVLY